MEEGRERGWSRAAVPTFEAGGPLGRSFQLSVPQPAQNSTL